MPLGLFRVATPDGRVRMATGEPAAGPTRILETEAGLDEVLAGEPGGFDRLLDAADSPLPAGTKVLAPVGTQEVWAAGVTYLRSRVARVEEAADGTPYDLVYAARRPELFFKAAGWRVRGPGEEIAVRRDSAWNTPEPELVLVLDTRMQVVAYTVGNDVSSRSIEGENPLYLPQAKCYDGSCAIGPCLVPVSAARPPFPIEMEIERDGMLAYRGETNTAELARSFEELAGYLGRATTFPVGALLLTGTSLVPESPFTLRSGDLVRISIEPIGVLHNRVVETGRDDEEVPEE